MKFRLPKKRRHRLFLYIVSTLLVLFAIDRVWMRYWRVIHLGYDTTHITGPLNPDGTVNYIAAINTAYSNGVTPENNAVPILLTAIGPDPAAPADLFPQLYARLGMQPLPAKGDYFESSFHYAQRMKSTLSGNEEDEFYYVALQTPSHGKEYPEIAAWVQANQIPLQLLLSATGRPRYFMPTLKMDDTQWWHLRDFRNLAHLASTRALLRFDQNDFAGANEDLLAIFRLAHLVGQGPTLLDRYNAFSIDKCGTDTVNALIATEKLTAPQARQILAQLDALSPFVDLTAIFELSLRYEILAKLTTIARESPGKMIAKLMPGDEGIPPERIQAAMDYIPVHFDALMCQVNSIYDRYTAALLISNTAQRRVEYRKVETEAEEIIRKYYNDPDTLDPATILLSLLLSRHDGVLSLSDRRLSHCDLTRVALALAAYHADQNRYPPTLSDLTPNYLPKIPLDRFTDRPLHYFPNLPGQPSGYLLYCVGENLIDDNGFGSGRPDPAHHYEYDDIAISIPRVFLRKPLPPVPATTTQPH